MTDARVALLRATTLLCTASLLAGCALPFPRALRWPLWPREPEIVRPPVVSTPGARLPAPEGLRAISGAYRRIPLQWDPLLTGEVGGYRIELATQRDGPYRPLQDLWGRGRIAWIDGAGEAALGDGETRFYRLRAFAPDGRLSELSSPVVVGTTAPLPDPPRGLRAYSRQPREVPLAWQPSEDPVVSGYGIERSPAPDGPFETIARLDGRYATAHVDAGLGDLRVFWYRVASRNPGGTHGPWSATVRAVTKPAPLPPLDLRVAEQRLGVNALAWEPNVETDIEAYRLYRTLEGAPPVLVASVPADTMRAEDTGVEAGAAATYTLVAVDRDGLTSRPSRPVLASGLRYDLSADATPERVRLRWNPRREEGFVGARIERSGWLGSRVLGSASDGEFVDPDVEPGGVYRYVVVLIRSGAREAPPSRSVEVRVPDSADFR